MRILLTGCFGFIGSNLLINLLNNRYDVIGIDNLSNSHDRNVSIIKNKTKLNWSKFKFYKSDIRQYDLINSIVYHDRVDAIINLAAMGSVQKSFANPTDTYSNNMMGFVNIMNLAKYYDIKKVIYASSSSVYGDQEKSLKSESMTPNPMSPYALSKISNEQFAKVFGDANEIGTIGLRFFNVFGPMQLADSPYSAAIPRFINDEKIIIYGDGSVIRDFTYVDDVVRGIVLSLEKENQDQIVLNIGRGNGRSIKSVAELISSKLDNKEILYKKARPFEAKESVADIDLAKEVIKYNPETVFQTAIDETIEFYKAN